MSKCIIFSNENPNTASLALNAWFNSDSSIRVLGITSASHCGKFVITVIYDSSLEGYDDSPIKRSDVPCIFSFTKHIVNSAFNIHPKYYCSLDKPNCEKECNGSTNCPKYRPLEV